MPILHHMFARPIVYLSVALLLGIFCLLTPSLRAQSATAILSGTVKDENGAVIPEASVTMTNTATGLGRQVKTNGEGNFTFPPLPPSTYTVTVQREGFQAIRIPDVVLNVNDQRSLQIQLKVGQISGETVQVDADPSLVDESPAVGTVINRQFVENLPLNGRTFQSLIALTPGTVLTTANGTAGQGQFSFNGQRTDANYFTVDGVSANVGFLAGGLGQSGAGAIPGFTALGGTNGLVSVDALQEFKVQTSTYAAEFGRTPGGQVSIVTRSGTNDFRGSLFEYFRNDVLDANDWFGSRAGLKKPALRQNDFGGVIGGPILLPRFGEGGRQPWYNGRNRTFFFFSYEGLRLRQPVVGITDVPSLATRQSALPQVRPYLDVFPIPNGPSAVNGLAKFTASFSNPGTLNATSVRVDHTINDKLSIFGRYNFSPSETQQRQTLPSRSLNNIFHTTSNIRTLTLGATSTITTKIVNEARFNYSRSSGSSFLTLDNFGGGIPLPNSLLYPSFITDGVATFNFAILGGTNPLYGVGPNADSLQRQVNIIDNLSITAGAHQVKTGIDYRRLSPIFGPSPYTQQIVFTPAGAASTNIAFAAFVNANAVKREPVFTNLSAYAQDTWRINKRLTFTYGVRWEYNPPPTENNGNDPAVIIGLDNPATISLAPTGTALWNATRNNFAPRLGVAYQLSQKPSREMLLRGGFGVFYDMGNGFASSAFETVYPYLASSGIRFNVPLPLSPELAARPPQSSPTTAQIVAFDPNLKLPYTLQWNVSVEQSLGANQSVTATYAAAAGRRLTRIDFLNRPNPNFGGVLVTRNTATSDYQSLQLQFKRRLTCGLQALASYTWSKSLDTASNDLFSNPPAALIDPTMDRGPSDFDVRHSFAGAVTYNIPSPIKSGFVNAILRNYSLDGIFRARSATSVNIITGTDIIGVGLTSVTRPDLMTGVPLYVNDSTAPGGRRINRAAFAIPSAGRQGTLGRNALRGFPVYQVDMALRRQFNLTERVKLQFRAEFFNVFNHPNFADPSNSLSDLLTFGQSTTMLNRSLSAGGAGGGLNPLYQIGGPRSGQLAVKITF